MVPLIPLGAMLLLAALFIAALLFGGIRGILNGTRHIEGVSVRMPTDHTKIDGDGAVRSIQGAEIDMPREMLEQMWSPEMLERLARTYWSFMSACTLHVLRVFYTREERYVCLLLPLPFLRLLTFYAPEYEIAADRGIVRWRIKSGLLVAPTGRDKDGYLEIDVKLRESPDPDRARVHVEVEVANFYPAIASRLGRWLYTNTQSRIHVIVTYGFLRRLAQRDLSQSVAGRFRTRDTWPAADHATGEPRRERSE